MSYCDDCGLSSCYVRGGYCDGRQRKIKTVVTALKRSIAVHVTWQSGIWTHVTLGSQYNYPQDGEWIEVIW